MSRRVSAIRAVNSECENPFRELPIPIFSEPPNYVGVKRVEIVPVAFDQSGPVISDSGDLRCRIRDGGEGSEEKSGMGFFNCVPRPSAISEQVTGDIRRTTRDRKNELPTKCGELAVSIVRV